MDNDLVFEKIKSGMVAIVGPPNAGKSTLMNTLLGQKISIVTPKPQTTRNRILGVVNGQGYQIVFIDTPGLHRADQPLNREMVRIATDSLADVEVILFIVDVSLPLHREESRQEDLKGYLANVKAPVILVLNKIDLIDKPKLLPLIETFSRSYPFAAVMPVSAKLGKGTESLLSEVLKYMPLGPRYFPDDVPTDATERFLVGEIIREKVFLLTGQEIPYATAVVIESFVEEERLITIHASIILEKNSQKGIIIGSGGHKLKSIGIAARKDVEKMVGQKVLLKLWVKVKKNWSQNEAFLRELGF